MKFPMPTEAGFYWAKWRICADGTKDGDEITPSDVPEVVEVWENSLDTSNPEFLMVHVPGVEKGQPLDGFVWLSARLEPPHSNDIARDAEAAAYRSGMQKP